MKNAMTIVLISGLVCLIMCLPVYFMFGAEVSQAMFFGGGSFGLIGFTYISIEELYNGKHNELP